MIQMAHGAMIFYTITLGLIMSAFCHADVSFSKLYGSDLGMGVGAKAIAMGGAFVAVADDPTAVFWNPAGLTTSKGSHAFVSGETPGYVSAAGVTVAPEVSFLKTFNTCFALSYINRLRFKADSGSGTWTGAPSHILDLSMVDIGESYSGAVDSATRDVRFSLAFSVGSNKNLSVGLNYMMIE